MSPWEGATGKSVNGSRKNDCGAWETCGRLVGYPADEDDKR